MTNEEKTDRDYIENFWIPQPGDLVKYENRGWVITSFQEGHPNQVSIRPSSHRAHKTTLAWMQDCQWEPTKTVTARILTRLGFTKVTTGEGYKLDKWFFKDPTKLSDFAAMIRTARLMRYNQGRDLISEYFQTKV